MTIKEVFKRPTVQSVHFEIRFPPLFYMEKIVGDYQVKIMDKFPHSRLVHRQKFVFVDTGPQSELQQISEEESQEATRKIWNFKSDQGVELKLHNNKLILTSIQHKTYNNDSVSSNKRFREAIKFAVNNFFIVTRIPLIKRVGLRYIDECPIHEKKNEFVKEYYKTTFPLSRFNITDAEEMQFFTRIHRGEYQFRFIESLMKKKDGEDYVLVMDFDGFSLKVEPENYLETTDKLHDLISKEYKNSIKKPLIEWMRKNKKENK